MLLCLLYFYTTIVSCVIDLMLIESEVLIEISAIESVLLQMIS